MEKISSDTSCCRNISEEHKCSWSNSIYSKVPTYIYFMRNGYKRLEFYLEKEKCTCDWCRRCHLLWENLEPYVEKGVSLQFGSAVKDFNMNRILAIAKNEDKYMNYRYDRDVTDLENCYFHLAIYSNDFLKLLPDDLKKLCIEEYRDSKPLISEYSMAGFAMYAHKDHTVGLIIQEDEMFKE